MDTPVPLGRRDLANDSWLVVGIHAAFGKGLGELNASGMIARPSGSSSPPSSNTMTPLHNRLQPCPGWSDTIRAAR
jgi:hypothetical protein